MTLTLTMNNFQHGKGLWKHNNSLLTDADYLKALNSKILEIKKQYCLPVYNLENIDQIPDEELQFIINDALFLETLMMEIRGKSISYASYKKKVKNKEEKELIYKIQNLEDNLVEENIPKVEQLKQELNNLREDKMQGYLVRSRANIIENGEKPSQYFCNLESHNYSSKIINVIEQENGEHINQKEILHETSKYYENLYSCRENTLNDIDLNIYMQNINMPKLTEEEAEKQEGMVTHKEASLTLKNMKNNKSPGTSGFSVDFFKVFWKQLGNFVVRAINLGFLQGELSITQQNGLIVCIPKENKCRNNLKNWRPITLLNTIYKIASGSIASRIKNVLDKLIATEQTGLIKDRYIGENTRLVYDLLQFTEEQNIPGLLLLIDFEKAFDSLSWSFIHKVLQFFNFGPSIRNWISTLYKNSSSAVSQCGCLSSFFKLGRGCRQGDPISPYLFILCAEILSVRIRNNKNIKGIKIDNVELKFSQYADDASAFLDGSRRSLEETLQELELFADISGLKTNFDKTHVVWIGAKKYSTDSIKTRWKLSWGSTQFKLLGIIFNVDLDKIIGLNYDDRIKQIKHSIKMWRMRFLTPLGKITVIKSLILPKITHLLIALPNPKPETLDNIDSIFYEYLWNGRAKIKQSVVVKQYFEGGLKMINLKAFSQALKITWLRRVLQKESKWQLFIKRAVAVERVFSCGSQYTKATLQKLKNNFWKDVFKALLVFQQQVNVNMDKFNILQTPVFDNELLTIGGKSFFYESWFDKGICYFRDFIDSQGIFYDFNTFINNTSINTNFLRYQGVIECLRKFKKNRKVNIKSYIFGPIIPKLISTILKQKKGSQNIYEILNKNNDEPTGKIKWNQIYNNIDEITWQYIFQAPFKITKCTKLRWFQTTINHKIMVTNKFLFQINLINSPNCSFCENYEETIDHLLWKCPKTQLFIQELIKQFKAMSVELDLKEETFILGNFSKSTPKIVQFLILIAKYFISMCRNTNKPLYFLTYKINVQSLFLSHRKIAVRNNELPEFLKSWRPFQELLTTG